MRPPVVGYALGHTWVVMLSAGLATGSPVVMLLVGVGVYPFFHLGVKVWQWWRTGVRRTGVRGWGQ
jgi:hypothetical protein